LISTLLLRPPSPAAEVRLPPRTELTTANGLKVILARRGPLPLVSVRLVVRAGSALDPRGKEGLAAFTARLLRRGTAHRSADELNEAVEFVGASLAVGASEDSLTLGLTTPTAHLPEMLKVVAELAAEPAFPEREVASARDRLLAELANDLDDPADVADRGLLRAVWGDQITPTATR
jgi:zinc protease